MLCSLALPCLCFMVFLFVCHASACELDLLCSARSSFCTAFDKSNKFKWGSARNHRSNRPRALCKRRLCRLCHMRFSVVTSDVIVPRLFRSLVCSPFGSQPFFPFFKSLGMSPSFLMPPKGTLVKGPRVMIHGTFFRPTLGRSKLPPAGKHGTLTLLVRKKPVLARIASATPNTVLLNVGKPSSLGHSYPAFSPPTVSCEPPMGELPLLPQRNFVPPF